MTKYLPLADSLRHRGYQVELHAFIVGTLGGWDPENDIVLRSLGINRQYALGLKDRMVADAIRGSRDVYVRHVAPGELAPNQ